MICLGRRETLKFYVFGHRNPDTDSITSAITYANLKRSQGWNIEPFALGPLNPETNFALNYWHVKAPRIITKIGHNDIKAILVDHNEFQQSVTDIAKANIFEVIDHHRISNFKTEHSIIYRSEPIGSTDSIIYQMYQQAHQKISKRIAGLLLSGIISDTLFLRSPTTTSRDRIYAAELSKIAKVNLNDYGTLLLRAGTNMINEQPADLINKDAKTFIIDHQK